MSNKKKLFMNVLKYERYIVSRHYLIFMFTDKIEVTDFANPV